jgi:plastocyanin
MSRLLALLLACFALAIVAAGCGGDDSDDGGGGDSGGAAAPAETEEQPAPSAEEPTDTGGGGGGGGPQVSMKDIKFNPETLKIKAGQTVTWTNDDSVGHDVTADDFKSGDPGAIDSGGTFEHTFKKAGTFDYVCSVHPGMEGKVEVK